MSLHLTSEIHEIFYISVFLLEKKYKRSKNLSYHHLQTPNAGITKTCLSEEIFRGQTSSLQLSLKQVVVPCVGYFVLKSLSSHLILRGLFQILINIILH